MKIKLMTKIIMMIRVWTSGWPGYGKKNQLVNHKIKYNNKIFYNLPSQPGWEEGPGARPKLT